MSSFPAGVTFHALLADGDRTFPLPDSSLDGEWHSRLDLKNGRLDLSVAPCSDSRWFAGVSWTGEGTIDLHLAIRVEAVFNDSGFTLVPGACYNGNGGLPITDIPTLASGRMEIPWAECSVPVALQTDGSGHGLSLSGAPKCQQGWCGCIVDRTNNALWQVAPVKAARRYRHCRWDDIPRPAATLHSGEVITTWFKVEHFAASTPVDLFARLFEHHRSVHGYAKHARAKQPLKAATRLIGDWMFKAHKFEAGGKPCFLNAFMPTNPVKPGDPDFHREWYQVTGWGGGPMTGRAMLSFGGELADYARKNLDFLAAECPGANGLSRPTFDGKQWYENIGETCSIRMPADYCNWMLRAATAEAAEGRPQPHWQAAARLGIDVLCDLWEKHHDFGYTWNFSTLELVIGGGTTGAFVLLALSEALRTWPDDARIKRVALEAAAQLAAHARKGRCQGGPLDILQADDSEAAAALTEALLHLWELTGDSALLDDAVIAGRVFASWVLPWSPPFPLGSPLDGTDICGGVLANTQNRHVGPGICTSSGRFLYDLSVATGDKRWEEIYRDVLTAAANCVPAKENEMFGLDNGMWSAVPPGMLTEQINVADCLNQPGEFWPVSASWGMTALMLAWAERPDLNADPLTEPLA